MNKKDIETRYAFITDLPDSELFDVIVPDQEDEE